MKSLIHVACATALLIAASAKAEEVLFESGTLGPTGITTDQLLSQEVPGTNVNQFVFVGARFQLTAPVVTSQIGGHFVETGAAGDLFGVLVSLTGPEDFPDSSDLSTPDVLGSTLIDFPSPSDRVYGDLEIALDPGWYGVVFGSGLFGATGAGAAVRNGTELSDVSYLRWSLGAGGSGWSSPIERFDGSLFWLSGVRVPEPGTVAIAVLALPAFAVRARCS